MCRSGQAPLPYDRSGRDWVAELCLCGGSMILITSIGPGIPLLNWQVVVEYMFLELF